MNNKNNPRAAGNFRANALKTIRKYIATTDWTPVFEFQPAKIFLSTPMEGGEVHYEGQATGGCPLVLNVEAPKLRATVLRDEQGPYVLMRCLRPGLWFSPQEETHYKGLVYAKAGITGIYGSGKKKVMTFTLPILLDPFDSGLEKLKNKHLKVIYDDIIKECPELAASNKLRGK